MHNANQTCGRLLAVLGLISSLIAFRVAADDAPALGIELLAGPSVRLSWSTNATGFWLEQREAVSSTGAWQPLGLQPTREGERFSHTLDVTPTARYFRLNSVGGLPLTVITETSPGNGASGVAVTRETVFQLSAPLAASTVLRSNDVWATFGGKRLLTRAELSSDRRQVTLFYLQNLPASARVTAALDGERLVDEAGVPVDADADNRPGGTKTIFFDTFSSSAVPGTAVIGRVFASELVPDPDNVNQTVNLPLAGVIITVDGAENDPQLRAVTDSSGFFQLQPAPAGSFFVHIDGRPAVGSQWPGGDYYPFVGKEWTAVAGRTNLAGGSGEIFLPLIRAGTLQPVSATQPTTVTFPTSVLSNNPALSGVNVTVPANALYSDDGRRGGMVGIAPVSPDRLPSPLPTGLNFPLVITIQTDGPLNFAQPAPVRFPNLPDPVTGRRLPPGAKSALWSFNHDTGQWEVVGPMTVTADGNFVETDAGVGVRQPGWHGTQPGTGGDGGDMNGGDGGGDNDGDGIPNNEDDDVDGDGVPNGEDDDVDGDGVPNGQDDDVDGDGSPNDQDPDVDGDGSPNGQDDDADGDGEPNASDGDDDGDGVPDEEDSGCEDPCDDGDPCTWNDICRDGVCVGEPLAGGPECDANAPAPVDQSGWTLTNNDADAGGNYTSHNGFTIQGGVCYDSSAKSWQFRVAQLQWLGKINTSLNGSTEPNPVDGGNVTESNYCGIIATMASYLGNGRGAWHTRAASLAHEQHHRDVDWPGILNPLWQAAEAALEAESFPCDADPSAIQSGFQQKVSQVQANLETQFTTGVSAYNAGHDSARNDGAYQAGQAVLDGMIQDVNDYADSKSWAACGTNAPVRGPNDPPPPRVVRLTATATRNLLEPGQTAQIQVIGTYDDGSTADLTAAPGIAYQSSAPAIITANTTGLVTGVGPGTTTVIVFFSPGRDVLPLLAAVKFSVPLPTDRDNDGMPDAWEQLYNLNPADLRDGALDADGDGLSNLREFQLGTNPRVADTDGDGSSDQQEVLRGTRPRQARIERPVPSLGLHYFVLMNLETGAIEQRGIAGRNGVAHNNLILAPNARYREWVFHPGSGRIATSDWITPDSGQRFRLPGFVLRRDNSTDSDGDGLSDRAEFILGSDVSNPDTDGDGVSDGAEVRAGSDPVDGLPVRTGVMANADTPGNAVDVAAGNAFAAVADSAAGVAIFTIESGFNPTLIAQVDTPGTARAVALIHQPTVQDVLRVATADGPAGLAVIDLQLPAHARITRQVNLGGNANSVATLGGLACVGLESGTVMLVDTASGTIIDRLDVKERINDLGFGGNTLFVATQSRLLAYALDDLAAGPLDSVPVSYFPEGITGRRRLFVGPEHAFVTSYPGYDVIDVRDPANLALVGPVTATGPNSFKQIVANGSGLGLAAVGVNPRADGTHHISLYDVTDATQTGRFLSTLPTPGTAHALSLYNGLAYVADGEVGLQVLNYLPYDAGRLPPSIALTADFPLNPPRAEEGKLVRVVANVADDVQVARVEFYVDSRRVAVDGNFPFETRFVTPGLAPGKTNFTLRARATDTGGNTAWSTEHTVALVPDATPPRVVRKVPAPGAIVGSADAVAAYFSEPISGVTLNAATFQLIFAGADGVIGSSDDAVVGGGQLDYRTTLNAAFLQFANSLSPGLYGARLRPPLADRAGNPLAAEVVWSFWVLGQTDLDSDGVPDNVEVALGLDPSKPDTDGDGILDGNEDPDQDRLRTSWELLFGYDPRLPDSDNNGMRDDAEDADNDGLRNYDEARLGASPRNPDSDGDGYDDNGEAIDGTDPTSATSTPALLVASTSASFLNAVPDVATSGTLLHAASPPASYLNAVSETVTLGTPLVLFSLPASYLNAVPETPPSGTAMNTISPSVSFLNAVPELFTGTAFVISPVASYQNQ